MAAATAARIEGLWSEVRELSLGGAVDRLDTPPSPVQFLRDYVLPNKPCVISDAAAHWPAIAAWSSTDYLLRAMDGADVSLHLTPDGRADSLAALPGSSSTLAFASAHVRRLPFSDALRRVVESADEASPFVAYLQEQNDCFRSEYAPLAGDVEPDVPWASAALGCRPEAVNMWIGNRRSETSFHKDHYENLYAVVSGEKQFLLLPPTDVHRLYVRLYPAARYSYCEESGEFSLELEEPLREVPWCSVDPYPAASDQEEQMSLFSRYFYGPEPFVCTVKAGDMLYLPSMWFHHVRQSPNSRGLTIAINYWYDMQFDVKYAYFNFLQSLEFPSDKKPEDSIHEHTENLENKQGNHIKTSPMLQRM